MSVARVGVHETALVRAALVAGWPVVVAGSALTGECARRWADARALLHRLDPAAPLRVLASPTRHFRYWRAGCDAAAAAAVDEDAPPPRSMRLTPGAFADLVALLQLEEEEEADGAEGVDGDGQQGSQELRFAYMQQQVDGPSSSALVREDLATVDAAWLADIRAWTRWGEPMTNMLFVGMAGVHTPPHFDEQENLFAQIAGRKRVRLADPSHYALMAPFPTAHGHDRQSTRLHIPDDIALTAELGPGDVLYIPRYWWHEVEALRSDAGALNVSLNFWFPGAAVDAATAVALRRKRDALGEAGRDADARAIDALLAGGAPS